MEGKGLKYKLFLLFVEFCISEFCNNTSGIRTLLLLIYGFGITSFRN